MLFFSATFVLVVLSGSEAELPSIGSCSFMEYYCDALKCNTDFIKKLQKDPKGDCHAKFGKMANCVKKTITICAGDTLSKSVIDHIVDQSFKEHTMCYEGALEIPTVPPTSVGSPCTSSFSVDANNCLRTFHQTFAADKSDPSLCQENANAKKCLKKLIASDCNFPSLVQEALDLAFSDYNPFCANNRDPGETGDDICYGVKDLNNPLNTAADGGMKSSVLQVLLFPFLFLVFFVKG